jgi:hypothetical protein
MNLLRCRLIVSRRASLEHPFFERDLLALCARTTVNGVEGDHGGDRRAGGWSAQASYDSWAQIDDAGSDDANVEQRRLLLDKERGGPPVMP